MGLDKLLREHGAKKAIEQGAWKHKGGSIRNFGKERAKTI